MPPLSTQCCAQLRSKKNTQCIMTRRFQCLTCGIHKHLEEFLSKQLNVKQLERVLKGAKWMSPLRFESELYVNNRYVKFVNSDSESESSESEESEKEPKKESGKATTNNLAADLGNLNLGVAGSSKRTFNLLTAAYEAIISSHTSTEDDDDPPSPPVRPTTTRAPLSPPPSPPPSELFRSRTDGTDQGNSKCQNKGKGRAY